MGQRAGFVGSKAAIITIIIIIFIIFTVIIKARFFWAWVDRWGALRGNEPTRAEEARGEVGLSRCARWGWVIASKARFGSLPLLPRLGRCRGCWGRGQATVGLWRILLR